MGCYVSFMVSYGILWGLYGSLWIGYGVYVIFMDVLWGLYGFMGILWNVIRRLTCVIFLHSFQPEPSQYLHATYELPFRFCLNLNIIYPSRVFICI